MWWLFLSASVLASSPAPAPVIDGVEIGIPLPELRKLRGSALQCGTDYDPSPEEGIAQAVCYAQDPSLGFAAALEYKPDRFAGHATAIHFWIFEDRVGRIDLALPAREFDRLLADFTGRWGTPEITRGPLRTPEGRRLDNTVARWRLGGHLVRFARYYEYNEEIAPFDVFSARYLEALAAQGVPSP